MQVVLNVTLRACAVADQYFALVIFFSVNNLFWRPLAFFSVLSPYLELKKLKLLIIHYVRYKFSTTIRPSCLAKISPRTNLSGRCFLKRSFKEN